MLKTSNPATGQVIQTYPLMDDQTLNAVINDAHHAFLNWRKTNFYTRSQHLLQVKDILCENEEHYARLISTEMGKPIKEALGEVRKCALVCEYYAENAEKFLSDELLEVDDKEAFLTYQPLGVVFSIMPWNYPFWQVFRFAIPAIAAGNAVLLKHAESVTGCALAISEIFKVAGFPKDLFHTLLIDHAQAEKVIQHKNVQAVTFTGSSQAGSKVAALAGANLKKNVLELGGSDPYLILADASMDQAIEACLKGRMLNAGQSCIAAKRLIAVERVYDEFVQKLEAEISKIQLGDPLDPNTNMGPLSSLKQRETVHGQVLSSVERGAQCVLGGEIPEGSGAYYPPTLLINVKKGMPAYDEELFGPVACVIKVKDTEDATRVANDSSFGLGGAVFTSDIEEAKIIAKRIETGGVAINQFLSSDPAIPFGGIKESGYGRELSYLGIREFTNIKSVVL